MFIVLCSECRILFPRYRKDRVSVDSAVIPKCSEPDEMIEKDVFRLEGGMFFANVRVGFVVKFTGYGFSVEMTQ